MPDWLMVAADTLSSGSLSTGILSPVNEDSLTALCPSITTPSTGILSPGLTINMSPFTTSSTGTLTSLPPLIILADLGANSINPFKASVVLPFEYASSIFPRVISVRIIAADSK